MAEIKLKYAVEQRIRFIDFIVNVYGYINRDTVSDYFGTSIPQTTADLKVYMKLAPKNVIYDRSRKSYLKLHTFDKLFQ